MNANLYDIIFPLLRTALWGKETYPFSCESDVDWEAVNQELKEQTIHHLPIDILGEVDVANSLSYLQQGGAALQSWYRLMQEQQALFDLFQKEHIPFVVLKGSAADCYYPNPYYRCMGDIDIIVRPDDFERAAACMEASGYALDSANPRHKEYKHNRVIIELHRLFSFLKDQETDLWMDQMIYAAIDRAQIVSMDSFSFPMLPPLENGLVLLAHINQHMEKGLGFRQIIDWMLYVDKEMTDAFWNTQFAPIAERIGLKTLAITVTFLCQKYLGLSKELTFCKDADPDLADALLEYIIEQGNFGQKKGVKGNAAANVLSFKDIPTFFSLLQKRGLRTWELLKKYPFLKPFAWLYQICRYIKLGLQRKNPFRKLKEEYAESKIRDEFFTRLQVTREADKE